MAAVFDIEVAASVAADDADVDDLRATLRRCIAELRQRNHELVSMAKQLKALRSELSDEEERSREYRHEANRAEQREESAAERRREVVDALDTLRDQLSDLAHARKDNELERLAREAEAALRKAGG